MPEINKRRGAPKSTRTARAAHARAGLMQQLLAAQLGVTYRTMHVGERGECGAQRLPKLAVALGCSIADLRQGETVCSQQEVDASIRRFERCPTEPSPAQPWDAEE
jgi:hypothetical protein